MAPSASAADAGQTTSRRRNAAGERTFQDAVIGKNLTDKYVAYYIGDAPSSGSGTGTAAAVRSDLAAAPNLPRTIAVQLTWKY